MDNKDTITQEVPSDVKFPKPLIEPKIEPDGTGVIYYDQGEVRFPFDLTSLTNTLNVIRSFNGLTIENLAIVNGIPVHELIVEQDLRWLVEGCVQNYWYLKTRGEIPTGVIRHHTERLRNHTRKMERIKQDPEAFKEDVMAGKGKKKNGKITKTELKAARVFVGFKKYLAFAGRSNSPAAKIYEALASSDGATIAAFAATIAKLGLKGKRKADVAARDYMRHFVAVGIAHARGEEPRKLTAKEFKAAEKKPKAERKPKAEKKPKAERKPLGLSNAITRFSKAKRRSLIPEEPVRPLSEIASETQTS